jgi:hypothetical protein
MSMQAGGALIVALGMAATSAAALAGTDSIDPAKLPAHAAKIEAWVPSGWVLGEVARGDLNGDGVEDAVFTLKLKSDDKDGPAFDPEARVVVVVLGEQGGYRLLEVDKNLVPGPGDLGVTGGDDAPVEPKIDKGILSFRWMGGSREGFSTALKLRYQDNAMRVIGQDDESWDGMCEEPRQAVSTNYLTGARIVTITKEKAAGDDCKAVSRKERQEKLARGAPPASSFNWGSQQDGK